MFVKNVEIPNTVGKSQYWNVNKSIALNDNCFCCIANAFKQSFGLKTGKNISMDIT